MDLSDLLSYASSLPETKWSVLKVSARIFDQLGLVSLFVIRLKLLFRSLCTDNVDWDSPLEGDALRNWKSLVSEFSNLDQVRVPRCYFESCLQPV